jgi:putative membrane protein
MMFLFWLPVLAIGAWFLSRNPNFGRQGEDSSAMEILKQRYARGEIGREEYLARKQDLAG